VLSGIDNFIDSYAEKQNFSGSLLLRKNDKVLMHKSYGLSNRQLSVGNTNETRYKITSVTKIFTSILILQLYEQGRIGQT